MSAADDQLITFRLDLDSLNLGNGSYLVSLALYRELMETAPEVYDLLDRSYEFEVRGNQAFDNGVFRHEATWQLASVDSLAATRPLRAERA